MRRPTGNSGPGFTLIELLVVIAVITVLLAIMLPGLSRARGAGRSAVCLSATRQIGAALWMYEAANKGYIPREGTMGTTPSTLRERLPWDVGFRPYLDERCTPDSNLDDMFVVAPYYRCPAHPKGPHGIHFVANGFAFRAPGVPDERGTNDPNFRRGPMPSWLIPLPAEMLYLTDLNDDEGDVMYRVWRRLGDTDISIGQCYDAWLPRHLTAGSGDFRVGPRRHSGGATALHLDGHSVHRPEGYFLDVTSWDDRYYTRK